MDRFARTLIDFSSRVLYHVIHRHISHDRAFQAALRENRKAARLVPLKILYRVSHDIVSDYYTIRFLEKKIYGSTGGLKRMAKLWLLFRGLESEHLQLHLESVERLKRKLVKSLPRRFESLEEALEDVEDPYERLAVKYSFPRWFAETMARLLGLEEAERLLEALNVEKWWIRVNTLKTDVDTVAERLLDKGVLVRRDPHLDYMLEVVDFSEPLHHLEEMWRGEIVFQDKASAMVVEALQPEPGDVILDMAAAPGVKDTLIMQLTDNKARIIAVDVSWERLKRTERVLKLYGADLTRIQLVHADSTVFLPRVKSFNKIILDAPCTSSGAIGKDPAIKLHLGDPAWVQRFPQLQEAMLDNALRGGADAVVYAVCSLLHVEGEEQIMRVLHRLELEEAGIPGAGPYPAYRGRLSRGAYRFLPHLHGTQGFFIARLRARGG